MTPEEFMSDLWKSIAAQMGLTPKQAEECKLHAGPWKPLHPVPTFDQSASDGLAMTPTPLMAAVEIEWRSWACASRRQLQVYRAGNGQEVCWVFAPQMGPGQ